MKSISNQINFTMCLLCKDRRGARVDLKKNLQEITILCSEYAMHTTCKHPYHKHENEVGYQGQPQCEATGKVQPMPQFQSFEGFVLDQKRGPPLVMPNFFCQESTTKSRLGLKKFVPNTQKRLVLFFQISGCLIKKES